MSRSLTGIYLITNHDAVSDEKLLDDVQAAIDAGGRIIQYRDKSGDNQKQLRQCRKLRELTRETQCLFLVNDNIELARQVKADGVHLGKDDGALQAARQYLGPESIIGSSCYNRLDLARQAEKLGADYVAFGRFFASGTKPEAVQATPELLVQAKRELHLPIVAIGGITHDNAAGLIKAGADMVAVIQAVFGQQDIKNATRLIQNLFTQQG